MMKKSTILLLSICLIGIYGNVFAQNKNKAKPVVEVLYFHATNRCVTCISIEKNTKSTLETSFAGELKNGKIKLTVLNSDEGKNKAICEKYGAYGATLILVKNANGKEKIEDLTNFAFSYSRNNPGKFKDGLKDKISQLLK